MSLSAAALAAPSADNRHVFRLEVDTGCLLLFGTDEFARAQATRRVLGLISIGAVAENLQLRARRLGLELRPQWLLDGAEGRPLARFSCVPAQPVDDAREAAIMLRHTNRRLRYGGPRLAPAAQEQLSLEATAIDGVQLVWLDQPAARRRALKIIRLAEAERFHNQALHRELFDSIRFDAGWCTSTPVGLPPGSLELPLLERPFFSLLRHWPVQRAANLLGAHWGLGVRAGDLPCRLAPHLCAVAAKGDLEAAALSAGRSLQRIWLRATTLGVSLQVFAASVVYAIEGSKAISPDLRARLASEWRELCPDARPFVVFRMGYAAPPSVRAGRPALDARVAGNLSADRG